MSAEALKTDMVSGDPTKNKTRQFFGKVKMAVSSFLAPSDSLHSLLTRYSANSAAVEGQNVYPFRALHVRDAWMSAGLVSTKARLRINEKKHRLHIAGKRRLRAADSSSEESESSSCPEDEDEEEDYVATSSSDKPSTRHPNSTAMGEECVGIPSSTGSNPTFAQLMAEFQKRLSAGNSGEAQASSVSPGQPGFAEQIIRALDSEPSNDSAEETEAPAINTTDSSARLGRHQPGEQKRKRDYDQVSLEQPRVLVASPRSQHGSVWPVLPSSPVSKIPLTLPNQTSTQMIPPVLATTSAHPGQPPNASMQRLSAIETHQLTSAERKQQNAVIEVSTFFNDKRTSTPQNSRDCLTAPCFFERVLESGNIPEHDIARILIVLPWIEENSFRRQLSMRRDNAGLCLRMLKSEISKAPLLKEVHEDCVVFYMEVVPKIAIN